MIGNIRIKDPFTNIELNAMVDPQKKVLKSNIPWYIVSLDTINMTTLDSSLIKK